MKIAKKIYKKINSNNKKKVLHRKVIQVKKKILQIIHKKILYK